MMVQTVSMSTMIYTISYLVASTIGILIVNAIGVNNGMYVCAFVAALALTSLLLVTELKASIRK